MRVGGRSPRDYLVTTARLKRRASARAAFFVGYWPNWLLSPVKAATQKVVGAVEHHVAWRVVLKMITVLLNICLILVFVSICRI